MEIKEALELIQNSGSMDAGIAWEAAEAVADELERVKQAQFSAEELLFIARAVKYHQSCWGSMYDDADKAFVQSLLKKLPESIDR